MTATKSGWKTIRRSTRLWILCLRPARFTRTSARSSRSELPILPDSKCAARGRASSELRTQSLIQFEMQGSAAERIHIQDVRLEENNLVPGITGIDSRRQLVKQFDALRGQQRQETQRALLQLAFGK